MKKLIRPQDILLMTLAGVGDMFEEVKDPFMLVGKAYENVYGFVPRQYKRHNFLKSVERTLETGCIEKVEKNGEVYLRLTTRGEKRVHRDFSLFSLAKKRWDRKWRIVFFDIEEASRNRRERLRTKLKELGFAMLQKSVWITPHDIGVDFYEFLQASGMSDYVFLIEGETLLAGNPKDLAWKIWHLGDLQKKYEDLESEIRKVKQLAARLADRRQKRKADSTDTLLKSVPLKSVPSSKKEQEKLETTKRVLKASYLSALLADPCLPRELLPDAWVGERVKREVKALPL